MLTVPPKPTKKSPHRAMLLALRCMVKRVPERFWSREELVGKEEALKYIRALINGGENAECG
jgi:hypothetical protein